MAWLPGPPLPVAEAALPLSEPPRVAEKPVLISKVPDVAEVAPFVRVLPPRPVAVPTPLDSDWLVPRLVLPPRPDTRPPLLRTVVLPVVDTNSPLALVPLAWAEVIRTVVNDEPAL